MKILYTFNPQWYRGLTLISITFWEMESLFLAAPGSCWKMGSEDPPALMGPKDILGN